MEEEKVNKKNIAKGALFILGFIILFCVFSNILFPKWYYCERTVTEGDTDKYQSFYEQDKNSIDVINVGASTSFYSFYPMEMYKNYGITCYNLGSSVQPINVSYYWLKESNKTQQPKCILLEVGTLVNREESAGKFWCSIGNMRFSGNRIEAILDYLYRLEAHEDGYLPFILLNFHERWDELSKIDFKKQSEYEEYFKGAFIQEGTNAYYGKQINDKTIITELSDQYINSYGKDIEPIDLSEAAIVTETKRRYFEEILSYCKENNIELMCYRGPVKVRWNEEREKATETFLSSYGITLLDFNDVVAIDWETETKDTGYHVNLFGGIKVSNYMGEYLQNKYGITDHRGETSYEKWDSLISEWNQYVCDTTAKMEESLKGNTQKATEYFGYLNSLDENKEIIIVVRDDASVGWREEWENAVKVLGISSEFYGRTQQSFIGIVSEGQNVYEKWSNDPLRYRDVITDADGEIHKLEVESRGMMSGDKCSIKIDDVEYAVNSRGLNIVIYDKVEQKVIDSIAMDTWGDGGIKRK